MTARILIAIACRNRRAVAEHCLPTIRDSINPMLDYISLWNDASTEYDDDWLRQFGAVTNMRTQQPMGIQAMRRFHLKDFLDGEWSHLYLTDHDILHDPTWRENALRLQGEYEAPLCLYNTRAHSDMPGNTKRDDPSEEVIWRQFAPGCSYLLRRQDVERMKWFIPNLRHFDWEIPSLLGKFATSRISYCDHIGIGGDRHPAGAGADEGDRATSPTNWLVAKRAEVVKALSCPSPKP